MKSFRDQRNKQESASHVVTILYSAATLDLKSAWKKRITTTFGLVLTKNFQSTSKRTSVSQGKTISRFSKGSFQVARLECFYGPALWFLSWRKIITKGRVSSRFWRNCRGYHLTWALFMSISSRRLLTLKIGNTHYI